MKALLLVLLLGILSPCIFAQTGREVSGIVQDSSGNSVISASVKLVAGKDTLRTATNSDGVFIFKGVASSQFLITITSLGYKTINKRFLFANGSLRLVLDPFIMNTTASLLKEVTISGTKGITLKEDTVEYKASDYELRENAVTEDLLKKLPGIEVDKDGNVTAQGKSITKVRVNGKDFFGGDVKTATQQIPADIIDKIQIVDDYGDQANLTGIKDGDPNKVLNIQVRKDKNNGYFANASAGYGTNDRYRIGGNANYFNNEKQVSFLGNLNNTNTALFNFGSSGSGGSSTGRGSRGGGRSRGSGSDGMSSGGDGLTNVSSIGINYRDEWSKELSSYGSYSYSNRDNTVTQNLVNTISLGNNTIQDIQNNQHNTLTDNHRFEWNLEYKADSLNYLKISPTLSYSKLTDTLASLFTSPSPGRQNTKSFSETPNFGGSVLYNHRFTKKGRNFSAQLSANANNNDQDYDNIYITGNYSRTNQHTKSNSFTTSASLSYLEPLSETQSIELEYRFSNVDYTNERIANSVDKNGIITYDPIVSTSYNYSFLTNRIGLNYRVNNKKYNYTLGIRAQPSVLNGQSLTLNTSYKNTGFNIIPVARYSYNFSRTKSFNAYYFGRSNEPTYQQVLPVADKSSDARNPVIGNPNLDAEFTHSVGVYYRNFNFSTGDVLFTNVSANLTQNKIVTNKVASTDPDVIQETRYLNADGYYALNAYYTYSKPISERKYVFSFSGLGSYNNNLSYIKNEKNEGKNTILSQALNLQINPAKWLEMNPGGRYTYNNTDYSIQTSSSVPTKIAAWALTWGSKTYFFDTWILGLDLNKTINKGYVGFNNESPFIINTYLEKQFFKKKNGTLRLQAYDLLDQNTSFSTTTSDNIISNSQSNRLSRYFLLSFALKLQKFGGQGQAPNNPTMNDPRQMMHGPIN